MRKILIIAHDAGGAEILGAYAKRFRTRDALVLYAGGPAASIFKRLSLHARKIDGSVRSIRSVVRKHRDVDFALLPLPGWMTKTEVRALAECKHAGMKTIVYLDSWTRYRERFGFPKKDWQKRLPDEFWAGDRWALTLARRYYPRRVRLVPNEYFAAAKQTGKGNGKDVLFLSSAPMYATRTLHATLKAMKKGHLTIRLHPADKKTRYAAVLKKFPDIRASLSTEPDIRKDIAKARLIIGTETVGLAVAALMQRRVLNVLPKGKSALPIPGIETVHSLPRIF